MPTPTPLATTVLFYKRVADRDQVTTWCWKAGAAATVWTPVGDKCSCWSCCQLPSKNRLRVVVATEYKVSLSTETLQSRHQGPTRKDDQKQDHSEQGVRNKLFWEAADASLFALYSSSLVSRRPVLCAIAISSDGGCCGCASAHHRPHQQR